MNSRIRLLDKNVAELIAAGEVIERPASIVKELVENSIDAGATSITIEIRRGGVSYIRVSDNGCGIPKGDIALAFMRHATSKVYSQNDLESIDTLGFRGEALASIAAVSKVEITSKTDECQFGTVMKIGDGYEVDPQEIGCGNGTTIIVKDLFHNVPARLKFLKRDATETTVISGIIDKLALSHPEISLKLICDGKTRLLTSGDNKLINAIHTVFGREFATSLISVDYEYNGILVKGYTSNQSSGRPNRLMQHYFVNSRYVRSKTCAAATDESYKNSIMIGKFPFCVLNICLPANQIDINVHPAKIEVRFVNERSVFDAIYFAIKSAFSKADEIKQIISSPVAMNQFKNDDSAQETLIPTAITPIKYDDMPHNYHQMTELKISDNIQYNSQLPNQEFNYISQKNFEKIIPTENQKPIIKRENPAEKAQKTDVVIRVIGELFKTYLLYEVNDYFILLDKHAAHERILYNKLKSTVTSEKRQVLLKPITVSLSIEEYIALSENSDIVKNMGFLIEEFGNNTFIIREVPLVLTEYNITDVLLSIAQKLSDKKQDVSSDMFESLLHSIACRAAIKANDFTGNDEYVFLIRQLLEDNELRHCPHGRPIVSVLSKSDIEKKFGRI